MRRRGDSLASLKSFFSKHHDQSEEGILSKSDYVVTGTATKQTITLQINTDEIKVYVHDEGEVSWNETVPFKNIKSITVPSKNLLAVDWIHGPYQTQDVSRFYTKEGEAKKIRERFYQLNSPTES